jgi:hypothetical protein
MEQISEQIPDENDSDLVIRLEGVINPVNPDSRAPVDGTKPATKLDLIVLRAVADATGADAEYSKYASYVDDAQLEANGNIKWGATELRYPGDGRKTKLIGLYPNSGTVELDDNGKTTVTYSGFKGEDDIMCSGFLEGSKGTPIPTENRMTFSHILTQVKVYVKGEDASTFEEWGNVTDITISGKAGNVVVTMPNPKDETAVPTLRLADGSEAALTVPNSTDGGVSFNHETPTSYGVVMFLPVTNEPLEFEVTTQWGGTTELSTTRETYAAATAYTITILFKNGGGVDISIGGGDDGSGDGSINSWENGNGGGTGETLPTS